MDIKTLLRKLEGIQTIPTVMDNLHVNRRQAIYYIHVLKKQGFVKTRRQSNNKRVYYISFENSLGGFSYYEIINRNSPIKLVEPKTDLVYGKEPTLEETLIYAIKTGSLRAMLAALALFRRIDDWSLLYHLAKESRVVRQVGALYDLARKVMRTRRMTSRFRNNALPKKSDGFEYIIQIQKI
ncbi:hypothetical protein HZB90_02195 [archaeon]|nr:hypothetical protein [archaeon]